MELNTINNTGSWGDAAARLNENFSKVNAEVEKARLASSKNKGLFGSLESLRSAYPTPQVGDWAVVVDSIPGPVYRCTTAGTWTNTGQTGGGGDVNLDAYLTATEITDVSTIL